MARGNIRPRTRKDGSRSYQVRVELAPDPATGARRARVETFNTRKDAEKALTKWVAESDIGAVVLPSKLTMRDLMRGWLDDEMAARVRPTTLEGYRLTVELHVIPHLGNVQAQRIGAADILQWRTDLLPDTSPRTTQLALQRLKQALDWAVSIDLLPKNPATKVNPPKWTPKERTVWNAEEARRFLVAAERLGALLSIDAGWRLST